MYDAGDPRSRLEKQYALDQDTEPSDARIQAQLGFMSDQVSKTRALFSELESRLEPILIPDMPVTDNELVNAVPPRKLASELSYTIDDLNSVISTIQKRIVSLTNRVQL